MYVLLYVDACNQPCFVQGTIAEINAHIHKAWVDNEIEQDDWDFHGRYNLLCIEDGRLTTVNDWVMTRAPQFTVN